MRKKLWLKKIFSDVLKAYMAAHGLTRNGLADRAGICVKNLNKVLNGKCDVKSETIQKLMQAIGLNDKIILVFLMNHVDETVKRKRGGGLIYNLLMFRTHEMKSRACHASKNAYNTYRRYKGTKAATQLKSKYEVHEHQ